MICENYNEIIEQIDEECKILAIKLKDKGKYVVSTELNSSDLNSYGMSIVELPLDSELDKPRTLMVLYINELDVFKFWRLNSFSRALNIIKDINKGNLDIESITEPYEIGTYFGLGARINKRE